MKCPGCKKELQSHEHAQPIAVLGVKVRPRSFCDTCCREHLWPAGSVESLERLITGNRDPIASRFVADLTSEWGLPFTATLVDRIPPALLDDTEPEDE